MRRKHPKQRFPKVPDAAFAAGTANPPLSVAALKSGAACRYLSVSNATLKRLEKRGLLHPVRFIREKRYPISQLDSLLRHSLDSLLSTTGTLEGAKQ